MRRRTQVFSVIAILVVLLGGAGILGFALHCWRQLDRLAGVDELHLLSHGAARSIEVADSAVTTEGVTALLHSEARRRFGRSGLSDRWGTDIRVKVELDGKSWRLVLTSAGPDRVLGTADDVRADNVYPVGTKDP